MATDNTGRPRQQPRTPGSARSQDKPDPQAAPVIIILTRPSTRNGQAPGKRLPQNSRPGTTSGPLTKLVEEIGRAATAGWPQTVRLVVLLTVAAAAIAIIIYASQ